METQDPIAALSSHRLPERAAAGRDLSKIGTPDLLPRLLGMAQNDPSPAVRLTMASAAADILSRYRVGPRAAALDGAARRRVLAVLRSLDPGVNPGLFPVLACLGLPEGLAPIKVGLRDPRSGVRVGAAVALLRLCMSSAAQGDRDLEREVVGLLSDARLPPDSVAEVGRVCAAVGYSSARPALSALALSGVHGEAVAAALAVLDAAEAPPWGVWVSDGRDAGEVNPEPGPAPAPVVAGPHGVLSADDGAWTLREDVDPAGLRRLFVRRPGETEPVPAVQSGGVTWYRASEAVVVEVIERALAPERRSWDAPGEAGALDLLAVENLLPVLGESGPELRASGLLLWRAGRLGDALATLEAAVEAKRAPADTWYFLGCALRATGRVGAAPAAFETYLKRERRKAAPFLELAAAGARGLVHQDT